MGEQLVPLCADTRKPSFSDVGRRKVENADGAMKKLLIGLLFVLNVFLSRAQANFSSELSTLLPPQNCNVDIMGLSYPKRFLELSEKLQMAVATNKDWWIGYIKENTKAGKPLPYSPKFGLTKREYADFLSLAEERTLKKTANSILNVKTNSGCYEFDGGSTLPELTGIKINLKELTVTTPFAILKNPTREESKDGPALGAFSGLRWYFEGGDVDRGNITSASFTIGTLKDSGRKFIYYKGSEMKATNVISDISVVIFYNKE